MRYEITTFAPTEMTNFLGLDFHISKIDSDEPYPFTTKIYQRQDGLFSVDGYGDVVLEELERIFDVFMYCQVD